MKWLAFAFTLALTACRVEPPPSPPAPFDRTTDSYPTSYPTIGDGEFTPLGRAILDDDLDSARRLLESGADPNVRTGARGDHHSLTVALLDYAGPRSPARKADFVRLLLQHGADPNTRWCPFETRGNGDEQWPTCRSAFGTTGLIEAAGFDWVEIVDLLLAAGADPRLQDWHGGAAIDYASDEQIIHAIGRVLFPAEAGHNARILALMDEHGGGWLSRGTTRLERALSPTWPPNASPRPPTPPGENDDRRQADLDETARIVSHVGAILRLGADPDERVTIGGADWPPLARAISDNRATVVRLLLNYGADPNVRWCVSPQRQPGAPRTEKAADCTAANGLTPMIWAAQENAFAAASILRASGADATLKDWTGRSAADYATTAEMRRLVSP